MTGTAPPQASDRIALAGSDVAIPPLGVGHLGLGRQGHLGHGRLRPVAHRATIHEAWDASIEAGVVLFDTAEVYGGGESERIIGRLLAADPAVRDRVVIASKFMPSPWKLDVHAALALGGAALARAARASSPSTCTRSTARSRCARTAPWPTPWPPPRPRVWSRRSASPTTRPRRRAPWTPPCANAGCGWPATRSSSHCCAPCR